MSDILKAIIHNPPESDARVAYEFHDEATEWEKEAIREYGVTKRSEVSAALAWREALDDLDDKVSRVFRGKHPTEDREIGRPKNPGNSNRPENAGP